jgi:hypothetical protein
MKNYNFDFYKKNLCIFAEYRGTSNFFKIYFGELTSVVSSFVAYGVSHPIKFKCMNLYQKGATKINFNKNEFEEEISFNSDVVFFIGFINIMYKNEVLNQAIEIRNNVWKKQTDL